MENKLYVVYNTLSQRYGDVTAFPSDAYALARLQPVLARQGDLSEFELCRVGSISVENGTITACPPERISWKSAAFSGSPVLANSKEL